MSERGIGPEAERILVAQLAGEARHHAKWRPLSQDEEAALYHHYGRGDEYDRYTEPARGGRGKADDAMTRSEEELRVDKERRAAGRARLRKYVVTEDVNMTVPVQREEVRVDQSVCVAA